MSANMKPQGGRNIRGPLLRGLTARSVTGKNGQAAKEEMSLRERGAGCRKNISDASAGRSVFHLTSLFIGLLVREVESGIAVEHLHPGFGEHLAGCLILRFSAAAGRIEHDADLDPAAVGRNYGMQN